MPSSCVAGYCSRQSKKHGVSLFNFPKDRHLLKKWVAHVQMKRADFDNGPVKPWTKLCSLHFEETSFRNLAQYRAGFSEVLQLNPDACPTKHPAPPGTETDHKTAADNGTARRPNLYQHRKEVTEILTNYDIKLAQQQEHEVVPEPEVELQVEPPTPEKQSSVCVQANLSASTCKKGTQTQQQKSKDASVQCNLLPSLRPIEDEVESVVMVPDGCDTSDVDDVDDPEYVPNPESEDEEEETLSSADPDVDSKLVVFRSQLDLLLSSCPNCCEPCTVKYSYFGSQVKVTRSCGFCQFKIQPWYSQPNVTGMKLPAGNLHLSAAILFSGNQFSKIDSFMKAMKLPLISRSAFDIHQRQYLMPTVHNHWKLEQDAIFSELRRMEGNLVMAGDGRCDSPGHCAKFGSYSSLELRIGKIIDVPLVQSNEVKSSNAMELEGLQRTVQRLSDQQLTVGTLVTDRHPSITKYIRENMKSTKHHVDIWHVAKGLKKKLQALGKQSGCELVQEWTPAIIRHMYWCAISTKDGNPDEIEAKWSSLTWHIIDVHDGFESTLYSQCQHPKLEGKERKKKWFKAGTKPYEQLNDILTNTRVLKDVRMLSPLRQTHSVESFHGLILLFAPKHTAFSYLGMQIRLFLAALHFNENSSRKFVEVDGERQLTVYRSKSKKGVPSAKWQKEESTRGYVEKLLSKLMEALETPEELQRWQASFTQEVVSKKPAPLTNQFPPINKQDVIANYRKLARF